MNCSIVGLSIRLPEGMTKEKFWNSLVEEHSFTSGMSLSRQAMHTGDQNRTWGTLSDIKGMYLDDIDCFDRRLFNLSNPALIFADPRQRLLLESCWSAIEDAGIRISDLKGKSVGVFLAQDGFDMSSYFHNIPQEELSNQEFIIPGTISSFLASRVANVFDFRGPAMVIDGTCSSIYMAIHHACQALENGECEFALVGGATIFLEPWKTNEIKPTSFETGVADIKSFSEQADGYCSSEGCGAILLKKSVEGVTDNFSSYGTILATGYNSGGKTRSFAQPNQEQQEILIRTLLSSAQKDLTEIDYIESHGIGSEIGDAIEGNAFINVLGKEGRRPCYVSTIKPNIGHAQASSGLYSLLKALLSLRYKKIIGIKGLDLAKINKAIPEEKKGIEFLTSVVDWNVASPDHKRLVLLSTYGASNVNAALLVEEFTVAPTHSETGDENFLICVSAESKEQLGEQLLKLQHYINENPEVNIKDLAFTLHVGREQLRFRFAALVRSLSDLTLALNTGLSADFEAKENNLFFGDKKFPQASVLSLMNDKAVFDSLLVKAFEEKKLEALAGYWVNGINIKWDFCYKNQNCSRLHLPTYTFSRERYWLPKPKGQGEPKGKLHPLLHANTSNIREIKFTSIFNGSEVFLRDHVVRGKKVLPGVAYLEMLRAAGELSVGKVTRFRNLLWLNPISVETDTKEIHISLFEEKDGIGYEVYSNSVDGNDEIIHGQGTLCVAELNPPPVYDVPGIMARLGNKSTAKDCYDFYERLGLSLGNTYKGIDTLFYSEEESLSKISIAKDSQYGWQLGLLDSTFQTGDLLTLSEQEGLRLPFCLKTLDVYGDVSQTCWAYARKVQAEENSQVCSHDIDMLSEEGKVLLSLKGFITIPLDGFQQDDASVVRQDELYSTSETSGNELFLEKTEWMILQLTAEMLRLEVTDISRDEELGDYGFDSIMMTRFANALNEYFDIDLLPTIFYSYSTIEKLSRYLNSKYIHALTQKYQLSSESPVGQKNELKDLSTKISGSLSRRKRSGEAVIFQTENKKNQSTEPVAVIGISGRFPGSPDLNSFWTNIRENKDLISLVPESRWDWKLFYGDPQEENGKTLSKWGGFIEDIDKFDPLFFGISPREAELMDPQQRITLEAVYNALEDAAIPARQIKGSKTGVFIGVSSSDYSSLITKHTDLATQAQFSTGWAHSVLANRISYWLDIHGPSQPIDTACSSSLIAIHRAVECIQNGHCEMAIAGGVNALISPELTLSFSKSGMLSADGKCKTFDKDANGYVRGEGVGIVILKSLKKAQADGDRIHAIIRSTAENHGGKANTLTSPNPIAQKDLLVEAYRKAEVSPDQVSYIEAHGTGTSLGDPIETEGLKYAFEELYEENGLKFPDVPHIKLGSVKTNIGHLEAAAGIAGVLKVILALKHKIIPGNPHLKNPNEYLNLRGTPFELQQNSSTWEAQGKTRVAGISSFGFGGANAHVVLEEYFQDHKMFHLDQPALILLSAKNEDRLRSVASNLHDFLANHTGHTLHEVAYTLQTGRDAMDARLAFIVNDLNDVQEKLLLYIHDNKEGFWNNDISHSKQDLKGTVTKLNIEQAIKNKELDVLAEWWIQGAEVDWSLLYKENQPAKIGLPTYPFERKRYWFKTNALSMLLNTSINNTESVEVKNVVNVSSTGKIILKPLDTFDSTYKKSIHKEAQPVPLIVLEDLSGLDSGEMNALNNPGKEEKQDHSGITDMILTNLRDILYLDSEIRLDKPFVELGMDSVIGVEFINILNKIFNIRLEATRLYDCPTVQQLSEHIAGVLNSKTPVQKTIANTVSSLQHNSNVQVNAIVDEVHDNNEVFEKVSEILKSILYLEGNIPDDKPFVELGLDSVIGVEFINSLNKQFGIKLEATRIYDCSTVRLLSDHIRDTYGFQFKKNNTKESLQNIIEVQLPSLVSVESVESFSGHKEEKISFQEIKYQSHNDAIAIVGLSGRYPKSETIHELWRNLKESKDCVSEIHGRWDVDKHFVKDGDKNGELYSKWLGQLDDIDLFDPLFFNISPSEAELMDPQQRIFLQECWKALEDGGFTRQNLKGIKCGTYVGIMGNEYSALIRNSDREYSNAQLMTGNSSSIFAARLAYWLDLKGPAISVDTACSSSLVATHLACQALWSGEIDMAVSGGVSLYLGIDNYRQMCAAGMLSPEGKCKTFDVSADGFVPGEGAGVLVLKRLTDAERDGDTIYGVIKASGINQDGKTNGITAPSMVSQADLLSDIYQKFNIDPAHISYVEAHGTGTRLGDPIEVEALNKVFKSKTSKRNYCGLGSIKSNLGHTSAAAGIAGITKVLLQMKYKEIAPTIHYNTLNNFIDLSDSPFYLSTELKKWEPVNHLPRLAAVSSFGFSGTNAHIVLEEYISKKKQTVMNGPAIILLSAKNEMQLIKQVENLSSFLKENESCNLHDLAYTLMTGRDYMEERLAFITSGISSLIEQLNDFVQGKIIKPIRGNSKNDQTDFVLTGKAGQAYIREAIRHQEVDNLARLWVRGISVDWSLLYTQFSPDKINLPTYPFAKEKYWIASYEEKEQSHLSRLHPLLHFNSSVLKQQRFSSEFYGTEFFLTDHKVNGEKVFPGVAYLEMARVAGELSLDHSVTHIKNVVWYTPLVISGAPVQVDITLFEEVSDNIGFEIYSLSGNEKEIHSEGQMDSKQHANSPTIDINQIRSRLTNKISGEQCYNWIRSLGIEYGKSFKGILCLYYNTEESLSEISLPYMNEFGLPPGLLDSAFQTCMGLYFAHGDNSLKFPYSVKEIILYHKPEETKWCYVRKSRSENTFDLDITSSLGKVLISVRGLTVLSIQNTVDSGIHNETSFHGISAFQDLCNKSILVLLIRMGLEECSYSGLNALRKSMGIIEQYDRLFNELIRNLSENNYLTAKDGKMLIPVHVKEKLKEFNSSREIEKAILENAGYEANLNLLKACLSSMELILKGNVRATDVIFPNGSMDLVSGIYKGNQEIDFFNKLLCDVADKIVRNKKEKLTGYGKIRILEIGAGTGGTSKLLFEALKEYKEHLEYIYTDISRSFLLYAEQEYKEIAPYIQTRLFDIESSPGSQGIEPESFDIIIGANVVHATKNIKNVLSNIRSILKTDGVLLLNEIARVEIFATLTFGLLDGWWMYEDPELRLDGSPGLSDDSWREVLMDTGFGNVEVYPVQNKQFYQIICAGDLTGLQSNLLRKDQASMPEKLFQEVSVLNKDLIISFVEDYVKQKFSTILKLDVSRIDVNTPFDQLGIDSIVIGNLAKVLSRDLEFITTTIFFEYRNIKDLAAYLAEKNHDFFYNQLSKEIVKPSVVETKNEVINTRSFTSGRLRTVPEKTDPTPDVVREKKEEIAIIGLSGKYPGAETIDEFWENLKNGRDCVIEIPKDRWDIDKYYDPQKGQAGKINSRWGGFLKNVDKFDPLFFKISPKEAEKMDPQERLFLQTAWEAIEDAGYSVRDLSYYTTKEKIRTGVYVGVMYEEYQLFGAELSLRGDQVSLGGSPASIANRVSYVCDFNGPSLAVDTMCSSSLTAIHLACKDLLNGDTDVAIAGGVNVSVHVNKYRALSQSNFLSGKGRCESFGENGDGFVPSEGVGAVVLKPLSKAIADGDHIYGVIKGVHVNHGGKTNGYTVPNPVAQAEVISNALKNANVKPDAFTYIEAHGTGTSLGDPIEISGLTKVFNTGAKSGQYCAIGSVKSNIGHAEAAAGIAGLTKVLLQLKYKKLVPSIHSKTLNRNINFDQTPFRVQQHFEDWRVDDNQLRLAGISSFGAGGSNAHLIVEEFIPVSDTTTYSISPVIILSARNEDRLREMLKKMLQYIKHTPSVSIHDMAYTLQVGREAMEKRIAIPVTDVKDLEVKIEDILNGKFNDVFHSQEPSDKAAGLLNTSKEYIQYLISIEDSNSLAAIWVNGIEVNWNMLYTSNKPHRISLPTYPFLKQRYWVPVSEDLLPGGDAGKLHPLLHSNESDWEEQKYHTLFTGKESFMVENKKDGYKVLSNLSTIEMAREAGFRNLKRSMNQLKDIVWFNPLQVNGTPVKVYVGIYDEGEAEEDFGFEIYSLPENGTDSGVIFSQGKFGMADLIIPQSIDIQYVKENLIYKIQGKGFYSEIKNKMEYPSNFQLIREFYYNENAALSTFLLPVNDQFVLQPELLEIAFQTCIGIALDTKKTVQESLCKVDEVTLSRNVREAKWCYAENVSGKELFDIERYNVKFLSESGEVVLSISGLTTKFSGIHQTEQQEGNNTFKVISTESSELFYKPVWCEVNVNHENITITPDFISGPIVIVGVVNSFSRALKYKLESLGNEVIILQHIETLPTGTHSVYILTGLYDNIVRSECLVFNTIKSLMTSYAKNLNLTVLTLATQALAKEEKVSSNGSGIIGLIGSLAKETTWNIRMIDIDKQDEETITAILRVPFLESGSLQILRNGSLYQRSLFPIAQNNNYNKQSLFKTSGVYVILGGAGGIGKVTTEYLVKKYKAQVYWLGRRKKDNEIESAISEIAQFGPAPEYIQCDASDLVSMKNAYQQIKVNGTAIHGLFHSAIVLHDMPLAVMEEDDFLKSFDAKALTSENFIEVFRLEKLDFICFYSSIQTYLNAGGQANYSAGCTFQDSYAREVEQTTGILCKTINWGYWGGVGVVSSPEYNQRMTQLGVGSISESEGMEAVEYLLSGNESQISVIKVIHQDGFKGLTVAGSGNDHVVKETLVVN